jgi:hypothetical protein
MHLECPTREKSHLWLTIQCEFWTDLEVLCQVTVVPCTSSSFLYFFLFESSSNRDDHP